MTQQNRVTPNGQIVAIDQRGMFIGNRGCIHEGFVVKRPWQTRRWIVCALAYKAFAAPKWVPGRWTALFFWDEAVAIAAGHRPCALCRRPAFNRWMDGWESANGERPNVDAMDRILHADRVGDDRGQRRHLQPWADLPCGVFVAVDSTPVMVLADRLLPWRAEADGYGEPLARPPRGDAVVLTPRASVAVLRHGYRPETAGDVR